MQECPVPLQFPLPNVVIATDGMPHYWIFYFQGSGLPKSFCRTWSGSVCDGYIAFQELHIYAYAT